MATRGDNAASAAMMAAAPQTTAPRPTINFSPAAGGAPPAQPGITKPDLPSAAPLLPEAIEPPTVTEQPPPAVTVQPAPTTARPVQPEPEPEPEPTNPAPPEQPAPPTDMREATVRGFCRGILNQMNNFPGGLAAMRASVPPPLFASPADWSEAFDRAASGSCG
ncbi:hypothetical protein [Nocardia crassostreae]|uniref:hypothetical protein n=1 Tax=Nocardia crassostreae TaxID=53428 RepID=UPI000835E2B3|nr:hypothetical protein [Nocardia crassostreae]